MLSLTMHVRVEAFGALKEVLGPDATTVTLEDGATVADLLRYLKRGYPAAQFQGIAVSVNAEYAAATQALRPEDEIGLLPPVSGGTRHGANTERAPGVDLDPSPGFGVVDLTRQPIPADQLIAAAKRFEDGAVVAFDGVVRNNSRGRETLFLDYEAYEAMALQQMRELAAQARERFGVRHATIVHRLGRLRIGETSVLIVVASAHRAQAFDACRWLIDTLKKSVPIWKKETFVDGAVWADGEPFPAGIGLEGSDAS
jgi:MoaE-MoaD fusion protein